MCARRYSPYLHRSRTACWGRAVHVPGLSVAHAPASWRENHGRKPMMEDAQPAGTPAKPRPDNAAARPASLAGAAEQTSLQVEFWRSPSCTSCCRSSPSSWRRPRTWCCTSRRCTSPCTWRRLGNWCRTRPGLAAHLAIGAPAAHFILQPPPLQSSVHLDPDSQVISTSHPAVFRCIRPWPRTTICSRPWCAGLAGARSPGLRSCRRCSRPAPIPPTRPRRRARRPSPPQAGAGLAPSAAGSATSAAAGVLASGAGGDPQRADHQRD